MRLTNFTKQTSERSDALNWAKRKLIDKTPFYYFGIEGCNQNSANQTTHLFERAHVDIDLTGKKDKHHVLESILELETPDALQSKINFANQFDLPLSYVLHNDDTGYVFILEFRSIDDATIVHSFSSYRAFGHYLTSIKGWKSSKAFREHEDLPLIDRILRQHRTPWPTNIDCFCSDEMGNPIGIIEFQNAKTTGVLRHSNNDYFLCKQKSQRSTKRGITTIYHDDIRRWASQELLRVQSELPLFVVTWSQDEPHFQLKQVEKVCFPDFEMEITQDRWSRISNYKEDLHRFAISPNESDFQVICNRNTLSFEKTDASIVTRQHHAPVALDTMTFPNIYWKRKAIIKDATDSLPLLLQQWILE